MKYNEGFRDLSPRQKIDHIWTYYRAYILAAVFVVVLILITVPQCTASEPQLDVIMINSDAEDSTPRGFEEFFAEFGWDYNDGAVALNTNLGFFSETELALMEEPAAAEQENMEKELMLSAWLAAGKTELFLGTEEKFLFFAGQGVLADLRSILPEALLARYEDSLIYTDEGGRAERYPCAVALSGNPWLMENGYYEGECYAGVLYLTDAPEMAARFMEFLLGQEAE